MMPAFRISDALRCVLLNTPQGPNLACARGNHSGHSSVQNLSLWKQALTQRDNRITLAWWNGIHLGGLASARTRAGPTVWEIDHFYLPGEGATPRHSPPEALGDVQETAVLEILERLVEVVGQRSAQRVFLRLPSGNPAICPARRSGFFPCFEEIRLEGVGGQAQDRDAQPPTSFRVRRDEDEFRLFQLFSAATPVMVREALGLTCDQWRDAQEPCRTGRQDWLREERGKVLGWLSLMPLRAATEPRVLARPEHPEVLSQMVSLALATPGKQRWLVPNYQPTVVDQLHLRGFQEMGRYTMLIKTVAVPAMRPGMAAVEA
jgi:hypothetical protein